MDGPIDLIVLRKIFHASFDEHRVRILIDVLTDCFNISIIALLEGQIRGFSQ